MRIEGHDDKKVHEMNCAVACNCAGLGKGSFLHALSLCPPHTLVSKLLAMLCSCVSSAPGAARTRSVSLISTTMSHGVGAGPDSLPVGKAVCQEALAAENLDVIFPRGVSPVVPVVEEVGKGVLTSTRAVGLAWGRVGYSRSLASFLCRSFAAGLPTMRKAVGVTCSAFQILAGEMQKKKLSIQPSRVVPHRSTT